MNKNTNTLYCLVVMLTIWCTWNSVKSGNLIKEVSDLTVNVHLFEREVASLIDRLDAFEQREMLKEIKELETETER